MTALRESESRPVILVVEDDEGQLRNRTRLLENKGATPIGARSATEALAELGASPGVDLVLTDIHLRAEAGDRSGVELARQVRAARSELPIVGYSAVFNDEDLQGDTDLFNLTLPKGRFKVRGIRAMIEECLDLATQHRRRRIRTAGTLLEVLRQRHQVSPPDIEFIRGLLLERSETTDTQRALSDAGYRLRLVDTTVTGFSRPVIVWVLHLADHLEAEVYGQPGLYADGATEHEAIQHLVELMRLYAAELNEDPAALAGPALDLKRFLDKFVSADE